jgi:hypothetical protein
MQEAHFYTKFKGEIYTPYIGISLVRGSQFLTSLMDIVLKFLTKKNVLSEMTEGWSI